MFKKLNLIRVQKELKKRGFGVFTPKDVQRIMGVKEHTLSVFLSKHSGDGVFAKLRNGLYALDALSPPIELIANKLYEPSYISLEYALAHYGIIPEIVYSVTSIAPKATREFIVEGRHYSYQRIQKKFFTGYLTLKVKGTSTLFASREKALADYLYFVDLGKKTLNDRLFLKHVSKKVLLNYVGLLERRSLVTLVKELL